MEFESADRIIIHQYAQSYPHSIGFDSWQWTTELNGPKPRVLGIILDGNRRWAHAHGYEDVGIGHRVGFGKIPDVLGWCEEAGVKAVTLWMLSTDNIRKRSTDELAQLYVIIEDVVGRLSASHRFRLRHIGLLNLLPDQLGKVLQEAEAYTHDVAGMLVNLAVGYGGRDDLLRAIRGMAGDIQQSGEAAITEERVAAHLSTSGEPDPDLIIRTAGDFRTSGFLLWQSTLAEWYFCENLWPDFTRADLLTALHSYAQRDRRLGA